MYGFLSNSCTRIPWEAAVAACLVTLFICLASMHNFIKLLSWPYFQISIFSITTVANKMPLIKLGMLD